MQFLLRWTFLGPGLTGKSSPHLRLRVLLTVACAAMVSVASSACSNHLPSTAEPEGIASLQLSGKVYALHNIRCVEMGTATLIAAKTETRGEVLVDTDREKITHIKFHADGVSYSWRPVATRGIPSPTLTKSGHTFTASGTIAATDDSHEPSIFTFIATCPTKKHHTSRSVEQTQ